MQYRECRKAETYDENPRKEDYQVRMTGTEQAMLVEELGYHLLPCMLTLPNIHRKQLGWQQIRGQSATD
jgi:hypothetical protein